MVRCLKYLILDTARIEYLAEVAVHFQTPPFVLLLLVETLQTIRGAQRFPETAVYRYRLNLGKMKLTNSLNSVCLRNEIMVR